LALLDVAHGRFSITDAADDDPAASADGPLVHSLLLEHAWLDDEVQKRIALVPAAEAALEPGPGMRPWGRGAADVPWGRVLEVVRARPGVRTGELSSLLPIAPARLRLALALLVESACVRVRPSEGTPGSGDRLAAVLSDLLLEALFSGQDVDALKVEILADAPGFAHGERWLAAIPDGLRDGVLDAVDGESGRLTAQLHHPTGRAEVVLRRLEADAGQPAIAADALFFVLLLLDPHPQARRQESRLLAELARTRPNATAMLWISSATPPDEPALPPWRRAGEVPASLEELFDRLLEARAT
jgi:hypothetical protein